MASISALPKPLRNGSAGSLPVATNGRSSLPATTASKSLFKFAATMGRSSLTVPGGMSGSVGRQTPARTGSRSCWSVRTMIVRPLLAMRRISASAGPPLWPTTATPWYSRAVQPIPKPDLRPFGGPAGRRDRLKALRAQRLPLIECCEERGEIRAGIKRACRHSPAARRRTRWFADAAPSSRRLTHVWGSARRFKRLRPWP